MKEWEELCSRCGLCCHEKVVGKDELVILSETCEFLDPETRLCKVYEDRFEKCPRCRKVNLARAMLAPYLPETCSYVLWARSHHLRLRKKRSMLFISE